MKHRPPSFEAMRAYAIAHPEMTHDDILVMTQDDDGNVTIVGHRPKAEWEKNIQWCDDPGNCSTHREKE